MGDQFTIHMDRESLGDLDLGEYDVEVTIARFQPDAEIAWTVKGNFNIGHVYGYRLQADGERTVVESYCDWSDIDPNFEWLFPVIDAKALRASLGILERITKRGYPRPAAAALKAPPAQPDTKNWTWVLEKACPDCGAEVGEMTPQEVSAANLEVASAMAMRLRTDPTVAQRPASDIWSPLEYACHVRDVYRRFLERVDLILEEDNPTFADWNPNETQEAENYHLQNPQDVAKELEADAQAFADRITSLPEGALERPASRSDGSSFTLETLLRYEAHDPIHHLWDIEQS